MTQHQQQPTGSTGQQTYGGGGQQSGGQQPASQMGSRQTGGRMGGQMGGQQPGSQVGGSQMPTGGQMGPQQSGQMGPQQSGQMGPQQSGQSHRTTHDKVGRQFEAEMTPELNEALESFDRVVEISEWCADKCIESGPEMAECARLCEDLADLASLNEKLIARDSINGPEVAEAFLTVAHQGMPILQQHQQTYHVRETLEAVQQSIDATNRLLSSIGGGQQMDQPMGIQEQVQQGPSY